MEGTGGCLTQEAYIHIYIHIYIYISPWCAQSSEGKGKGTDYRRPSLKCLIGHYVDRQPLRTITLNLGHHSNEMRFSQHIPVSRD